MRRLSAIFLLALAAGCSNAGDVPAPPAPDVLVARFTPGGAQDVIEVEMRGRIGARAVALVAPDGTQTPAYRLEVQPARRPPREYGAMPASPAAGFVLPGAPSATAVTDTIVSTAFLRIPNVVEYRRNWRDYRIRVETGTGPEAGTALTLRAPPPG